MTDSYSRREFFSASLSFCKDDFSQTEEMKDFFPYSCINVNISLAHIG